MYLKYGVLYLILTRPKFAVHSFICMPNIEFSSWGAEISFPESRINPLSEYRRGVAWAEKDAYVDTPAPGSLRRFYPSSYSLTWDPEYLIDAKYTTWITSHIPSSPSSSTKSSIFPIWMPQIVDFAPPPPQHFLLR